MPDNNTVSMTAPNATAVPPGAQTQTANSGFTQTAEFTHSKLLDAQGLLDALFEPSCRPSLRWVREHQGKAFPMIRMGRRVFFNLAKVQLAIELKRTVGLGLTRSR